MHILLLNNVPILEQLQMEEALLRADTGEWCVINTGAPPAIVMGISGKPEKLLNVDKVQRDQIPVIKRFSGGGTVYIDQNTVFVTFISNNGVAQPKAIMEWSEKIYQPLFPGFSLRENDYVFGEKKFGGNAQYIQKNRWLHHTSFLWDYTAANMDYLLLPERRPKYREDRTHTDFLCTLRPHFPEKKELIDGVVELVGGTRVSDISEILARPHRKASIRLDLGDAPQSTPRT